MSEIITSEADLIAMLAPLAVGAAGAFGLRDDCATLTPRAGYDLVFKTDPIRAGVHFFPDDPPDAIAWKALAVNVSDLAAKGATPRAYLMALSFPEAPQRSWMRTFADGLAEAQRAFGMSLIGGDTDKAADPLSIGITVIGEVPTGRMVQRGTAKVGDVLYVSGHLGDSGLGLQLHRQARDGRQDLRRQWALADADAQTLIGRYLRPVPRIGLSSAVLQHASAAMDVSDGLVKDLERMCRASGIGAVVDGARLPLSEPATKVLTQAPELFLKVISAGDDYEILATVCQAQVAAFEALCSHGMTRFHRIGVVVAGSGVTVTRADGTAIAFDRVGWDHF